MGPHSIGTPLLWVGFTLFVLAVLGLDLAVFHRKAHAVQTREAILWTWFWMILALLFNAGVYIWAGPGRGLEFLTAYLIEQSLSVDNIFVFLVIFSYFAVPEDLQHRVLFWGILGAMLLRAIFIMLGAALLQKFEWITYIFGGFLLVTGLKMLVQRKSEVHPEKNPLLRIVRRLIPTVSDYRSSNFTVVIAGKRYATLLLLVLVAVEATDILFAVDSIPAIFSITRDPFIVYTSNIFAILGLRALYFVLAGVIGKFHHLRIGLALVLAFCGGKMLVEGFYKPPIVATLAVVALLLGGSIASSVLWPPARLPASPK